MDLNVNGIMKLPTDINYDNIEVNGILKIAGKVNAKKFYGDGIITCMQDVVVDEVKLTGIVKILGKLDSKQINLEGIVKVQKIQADDCDVKGKLFVESSINCEVFTAEFDSKSKIAEIEGSIVKIMNHFKKHKLVLIAKSITADEITLENVECDYVSGDRIIIGRNCNIKRIVYRTSLSVHENAIVKEQQKLEE